MVVTALVGLFVFIVVVLIILYGKVWVQAYMSNARVSMLSGAAQLDGFGVKQVINGGLYSQFFAVPEPSTPALLALGLAWLGGAGAALVLLARHPVGGPGLVLAVALAVALSDVGAYLVGRAVGGPRLAPTVSPGKTRAGLAGNVLGAAVGLALLAPWVAYPVPHP